MPKRRANGEGNIRKRKDGRWEGRYTVGHDPETGKAIIKSVLGKTLLKAFIFALTQQDALPKTILFYNSGAFVTSTEGPSIEDLKTLEAQGVDILTCGTCLDYYHRKEKLLVGGITNMYSIVETLEKADVVVKP